MYTLVLSFAVLALDVVFVVEPVALAVLRMLQHLMELGESMVLYCFTRARLGSTGVASSVTSEALRLGAVWTAAGPDFGGILMMCVV